MSDEAVPAWLPRDESNDLPLPSDIAFTMFLAGCDLDVVILDYRSGMTAVENRYLMNRPAANG